MFFFASAGVSAAYLTVSEIFPMETRALAIAMFYAVGTGLGGIIGRSCSDGSCRLATRPTCSTPSRIGAILMIIGGVIEIVFGVKAERKAARGHRQAAHRGRWRGADERAQSRLRGGRCPAPAALDIARHSVAKASSAPRAASLPRGSDAVRALNDLQVGHHHRPDTDDVAIRDVGGDDRRPFTNVPFALRLSSKRV